MSKASEFIDFWIENSVHAAERYRSPGASQDVAELARRCVEAAEAQGVPASDIKAEIGDVAAYIAGKLKAANRIESDRPK